MADHPLKPREPLLDPIRNNDYRLKVAWRLEIVLQTPPSVTWL